MRLSRRHILQLAAGAATLPALAGDAWAQTYPSRTVKLVLSEAAGSSNDVIARILAPGLSSYLGQPVIVENRPGGGTVIGMRTVMTSPPDGYTLLVSSSSVLITSSLLNKSFTFDLGKDITPIAGVASTSWVLVMNPAVPAKSLPELVAYAKANPGKLNIGYGQGTGPQLVAESFKSSAGLNIVGIPYSGGSQVVKDLLGGTVQLYFGSPATTLSQIESGALKALVVTGTSRDALLPKVPTMKEAGFPDLTLASMLGVFGPPQLPAAIVEKIYRGVEESMRAPKLQDSMRRVGYEPNVTPQKDFVALLKHYKQIWTPLVRGVESGSK